MVFSMLLAISVISLWALLFESRTETNNLAAEVSNILLPRITADESISSSAIERL